MSTRTDFHSTDFTIVVIPNPHPEKNHGKLADAELHFTGGPLSGLKLVGFAIWPPRGGHGHNVTFPQRTYSVNGERRAFSLLRPETDATATRPLAAEILAAYRRSQQ